MLLRLLRKKDQNYMRSGGMRCREASKRRPKHCKYGHKYWSGRLRVERNG
jgi:hypothetical protein